MLQLGQHKTSKDSLINMGKKIVDKAVEIDKDIQWLYEYADSITVENSKLSYKNCKREKEKNFCIRRLREMIDRGGQAIDVWTLDLNVSNNIITKFPNVLKFNEESHIWVDCSKNGGIKDWSIFPVELSSLKLQNNICKNFDGYNTNAEILGISGNDIEDVKGLYSFVKSGMKKDSLLFLKVELGVFNEKFKDYSTLKKLLNLLMKIKGCWICVTFKNPVAAEMTEFFNDDRWTESRSFNWSTISFSFENRD